MALAISKPLLPGISARDVSEKYKAGLVASVALWSLREMHAIDFSSWEHRRWWWPVDPVVELMVEIASGDVPIPEIQPYAPFRGPQVSLEQELLNQVRIIASGPHEGADSAVRARDVIYEWLGDYYENPHREVIERVAEQGKTAGCFEVVPRRRANPIARLLLGPRLVSIPSPARASELERAAQSLAGEWQRFLREESAISSWLMATVMDAIRARTLHPNTD